MNDLYCKSAIPAKSLFASYDELYGVEKELADNILKKCNSDVRDVKQPVVTLQAITTVPAPVMNNSAVVPQEQPKEQLAAIRYKFIQELNRMNILKRYNDVLYMLDGNIYRSYNENTFLNHVYVYILGRGVELGYQEVFKIVNELKMRAYTFVGEPNDERYTYCQNGYFNNRTGTMETDTPYNYFPTIQLAGSYLGVAPQTHPLMDNFLSTLFNRNAMLIQRAWEIIGYCISSDAHAKRFFIFPGASGDNGKSTFIDLISRLLVGPAIAGMCMKNLLCGNFAESELQGKRINVSSDEGAVNFDSSQFAALKRISGHDMITADKKNSSQVSFLCTCKIIIASNHNIGMAYSSNDCAVMRRICTLPFDVKIPRYKQNPDIVNMILHLEQDEITTEALNAFIRLKNNGYHFTGDDTGLDDYTISNTPVNNQYMEIEDFVNKFIEYEPGNFVLTQTLYEKFTHNYGFNIFKDITGFSQALYRYLTANGFNIQKTKKHQGHGYEDIKIVNI